jgi:hypothetical protein
VYCRGSLWGGVFQCGIRLQYVLLDGMSVQSSENCFNSKARVHQFEEAHYPQFLWRDRAFDEHGAEDTRPECRVLCKISQINLKMCRTQIVKQTKPGNRGWPPRITTDGQDVR